MNFSSLIQTRKDLRQWMLVLILMNLAVHGMHIVLIGMPNSMWGSVNLNVHSIFGFIGFHLGVAALILEMGGVYKNSISSTAGWFAIGVGAYGYSLWIEQSATVDPTWNALVLVSGFGIKHLALFLQALFRKITKHDALPLQNIVYVQLCALVTLLSMATGLALELTKVLFPGTADYHAYRIDGAFFGLAAWCAKTFDHGWPVLQTATFTIYALLVICFYIVIGLLIRERKISELNGWRTLILPFTIAWFCYAWVPVSGPIYVFFDGRFPHSLPLITDIPAATVIVPPYARNGMPSFHLTGAILMWMLSAGLRNKLTFICTSILVFGTFWATMALGEHYAIDLVVAVPFALALGWTLIDPHEGMSSSPTNRLVAAGWGTFISWMALLVICPEWLSHHLWFVRFLSMWSFIVAGVMAAAYFRVVWNPQVSISNDIPASIKPMDSFSCPQREHVQKWIFGIFFASGFAGLVYEVVFAKALALTFGSTSLAAYTVLTVYMGGMAAGAWLGGNLASRTNRPLIAYAICEAAIGVYAVLTPVLFTAIQWLYVRIGENTLPDAGWLTGLRVVLGALALALPTTLMGATLPLMFKHVSSQGVKKRSAIANLYSANVLGAALGSLIAGYAILPALGRNGATYIAAILSLMIALYVIARIKKGEGDANQPSNFLVDPQPRAEKILNHSGRLLGIGALTVLGVGGAVTLALEVVSMHMLATVAGSSVYAFGLMLGAFLFGLGGGASVGERIVAKMANTHVILIAQSGLALSIALTAHSWDLLPGYFGSFGMTPVYFGFGGRELIRAMVCLVAMTPAAFFIGLGYPAAMTLASEWLSPTNPAKGVGIASGINTLGNISGVLLAGFLILPWLGSKNTLLILSCIALALAVLFMLLEKIDENSSIWRGRLILFFCAFLAILNFPRDWDWGELSSGSNVYFAPQRWGKVIDHAESVEGGITSVTRNKDNILTLLTNGKFQGNNSMGGEMQAQASFALLPLLHTEKRKNALVIGYGTGMTAQVLHEQNFDHIDIAELSADLVGLANKYFDTINHGVTNKKSVDLHFTDGRNFLLTQSKKYDLISIELTSIWFAGAANLYNKDFYDLTRTRLQEGGVLQQWVQLHHMNQMDLIYILGSIRSEFKYVWVYFSGGQGVVVASNSKRAVDNERAVQLLEKSPSTGVYKLDVREIQKRLIADPARIDALLSEFDPTLQSIVSTDANLYLEYSTPKGNAVREDTVSKNLSLLRGRNQGGLVE
jgi:spermidine synthase